MKIKETILLMEKEQFLSEEKYSDQKIKSEINKIEKGLDVGKDQKYRKISKIEGEEHSAKVQGSKKSYNEIADEASKIRKGLMLGAYIGKSPEDKKKMVPRKLKQLKNMTDKMRFHKNIVNKASGESSKISHRKAAEKLREPIRKKVEMERKVEKAEKKMKKGAKKQKKGEWEKRVRSNIDKASGLANF